MEHSGEGPFQDRASREETTEKISALETPGCGTAVQLLHLMVARKAKGPLVYFTQGTGDAFWGYLEEGMRCKPRG